MPVTIVTGFLGAGKTTLLNRVLKERHGLRVCVIENEFADDVGVESLIMKDGLGRDEGGGLFSLPNGCMCCSMRDGLVLTLERVLAERDAFDYILVEPSGLASPGPIAATFYEATEEGGALRLDGIIAVVDAARILSQLDEPRAAGVLNEPLQQVACADVILLNKVDTVESEAALGAIEERLRSINGLARITRSVRCETDLRSLLDIRAFDNAAFVGPVARASDAAGGGDGHAHEHTSECGCGAGPAIVTDAHHTHDARIRTIVLRCERPLSRRAFAEWMGHLLWDNLGAAEEEGLPPPTCILRGKGVLCIYAESEEVHPARHIFQSVCETMDVHEATGEAAPWEAGTPRHSVVVLIGRALDEAALQAGLLACSGARP